MKKLLLLFVLLTGLSKAQCNWTVFPNDICNSSQTLTIPATTQSDIIYLCSSGAVVYDTLDPVSVKFRGVLVNSGSTYHYKTSLTSNIGLSISAKNGSTVIIYPNSNIGSSFVIEKEPAATIINLSTGTITINNCASITDGFNFCSVTSIGKLNSNSTQANVWPNPAHDRLFISTENGKDKTVSIINLLGEVVYSQKGIKEEKQEISLSNFATGIYYVIIKSEGNTETKKIVVTR